MYEYLKDGQDAAVPDEALKGIVLGITQTSEHLKSLAHTNPASLRAEHLYRRWGTHTVSSFIKVSPEHRRQQVVPWPWLPPENSLERPVCPSSLLSGMPCSPSRRHWGPSLQTSPTESIEITIFSHFWSDWKVSQASRWGESIPGSYQTHSGFC